MPLLAPLALFIVLAMRGVADTNALSNATVTVSMTKLTASKHTGTLKVLENDIKRSNLLSNGLHDGPNTPDILLNDYTVQGATRLTLALVARPRSVSLVNFGLA
jgi:hypothetical protein